MNLLKSYPKITKSGKSAALSQYAPDQPSIPKKKRRQAIRKLKVADYVMEEEDNIAAATGLVTRELEKKKAEDAAALANIWELAKGIEVPVSSIAREDVGISAHQVVKAAEKVQDLVTSEVGSLLVIW